LGQAAGGDKTEVAGSGNFRQQGAEKRGFSDGPRLIWNSGILVTPMAPVIELAPNR
jgi:hypothetical protein